MSTVSAVTLEGSKCILYNYVFKMENEEERSQSGASQLRSGSV